MRCVCLLARAPCGHLHLIRKVAQIGLLVLELVLVLGPQDEHGPPLLVGTCRPHDFARGCNSPEVSIGSCMHILPVAPAGAAGASAAACCHCPAAVHARQSALHALRERVMQSMPPHSNDRATATFSSPARDQFWPLSSAELRSNYGWLLGTCAHSQNRRNLPATGTDTEPGTAPLKCLTQ